MITAEDKELLLRAMDELGKAHDMLARTKLTTPEYSPISEKLALAKVDLFKMYENVLQTKPQPDTFKQQIMEAWKDGFTMGLEIDGIDKDLLEDDAKDYYNQKYNQQ